MKAQISGQNYKEIKDLPIASMYLSPMYISHRVVFNKS